MLKGTKEEMVALLNSTTFNPIISSIRFSVDLSSSSWMKCGGIAIAVFKPKNLEELVFFAKNFPFKDNIFFLGACSNVIIRDGGIDGVVIKLGKVFANIFINDDNSVTFGGAVLDASASIFCIQNNIGGLEFLSGIPGTIGANVRMNAGCYGTQISDVVKEVKAVDIKNGNILTFTREEIPFEYRGNGMPKDMLFVEAVLSAKKDSRVSITKKIADFKKRREATQPIRERTTGSTFKNPKNHKAWELIEKCGLRGHSIGGAMFSDLHCNFIVNNGNATSEDIETLGQLAIDRVKNMFGINMEWEVERIGQAKH